MKIDTPVTRACSRAVRYEIVRADGVILPVKFETAAHAAEVAKEMFFYEEQDEERTGKGWDIQVVGS